MVVCLTPPLRVAVLLVPPRRRRGVVCTEQFPVCVYRYAAGH